MTIRQRSTGWAIHLGLKDNELADCFYARRSDALATDEGEIKVFCARSGARNCLRSWKSRTAWPYPRARVVAVDIRVETRG